MGGKVWINNTSGQTLFEAYYGDNGATCDREAPGDCLDEYKLDGIINNLEIGDARKRLERKINQSWFEPLQPWQIQEEDPVDTPDGYTMLVTLHMDERYLGNSGWWIFQPYETITKEILVSMRWEGGRIRLYQCEPPPYAPQQEEPAPTKPGVEDTGLISSFLTYVLGPGAVALND